MDANGLSDPYCMLAALDADEGHKERTRKPGEDKKLLLSQIRKQGEIKFTKVLKG